MTVHIKIVSNYFKYLYFKHIFKTCFKKVHWTSCFIIFSYLVGYKKYFENMTKRIFLFQILNNKQLSSFWTTEFV